MTHINLVRNLLRNPISNEGFRNNSTTLDSVAWGKSNFEKTASTVVFAGLLIVCSMAVGCSSDSPKPVSTNNQAPVSQSTTQTLASSSLPAPLATEVKPAQKKIARKRPATVTYVDKSYGVSFEYPRRYAIETGDAANDLLTSSVLPMNFVMPGGTALAAVELPETGFANTDFSSAFFDVSVNKAVSEEDCGKFSVPQVAASTVATVTPADSNHSDPAKAEPAKEAETGSSAQTSSTSTTAVPDTASTGNTSAIPASKLMLGDMEMQRAEAVAGEGNRQSDSKYFHVYQNGACYEFALNVTTVATQNDGGMKHVDRDKVFERLEKILATVKINPVEEKETAETPAPTPTAAAESPAQ